MDKKAMSKEELTKKAQSLLKQYDRQECLATEDGSLFWPENKSYAESRARDLMRVEGFKGEVVTIKAQKKAQAEPKAEKSKASSKKPATGK